MSTTPTSTPPTKPLAGEPSSAPTGQNTSTSILSTFNTGVGFETHSQYLAEQEISNLNPKAPEPLQSIIQVAKLDHIASQLALFQTHLTVTQNKLAEMDTLIRSAPVQKQRADAMRDIDALAQIVENLEWLKRCVKGAGREKSEEVGKSDGEREDPLTVHHDYMEKHSLLFRGLRAELRSDLGEENRDVLVL